MKCVLIDSTARSAWQSATSQQAQLEALDALFPSGPTLRYYASNGTHLDTVTHAVGSIATGTDPRTWSPGAVSARTNVTTGTATYVIAATAPSGGTDILRADIAPMTIVTGSRPNLQPQTGGAGLVVQADAGLPAVDLPAWLAGVAVNESVEIAGTAIRAGTGTRLAYSGLANRDTLLVLACTGGHGDSSDNGVDSLDLSADTPAWTARRAPFATPVTERNYYRTTPTVEPSSRHTYEYNRYNPVLDRLMLYTTAVPWGNSAPEVPQATNGLNLTTWEFDPAGTYVAAGGCYVQDSAGRAYARRGFYAPNEYDPVANTVTELAGFAGEIGSPIAHDTSRDVFFQCSYGDGRGGGPSRLLFRYSARFATQTAITFNSSAAATALNALADSDATMFYVAALDAYFYWSGTASTLFKIVPNSGTTWDVSVVTITGASMPSLTSVQRDSHSRACYVPSLGVMAWLPNATSNLYCIRLA